jgi:hypothetical protein
MEDTNLMTKPRQQNTTQRQTEEPNSKTPLTTRSFGISYPNIVAWVSNGGWVEIGYETYTDSFVRALDEGGMIWEGAKKYKTVDDALQALEKGIGKWLEENY